MSKHICKACGVDDPLGPHVTVKRIEELEAAVAEKANHGDYPEYVLTQINQGLKARLLVFENGYHVKRQNVLIFKLQQQRDKLATQLGLEGQSNT